MFDKNARSKLKARARIGGLVVDCIDPSQGYSVLYNHISLKIDLSNARTNVMENILRNILLRQSLPREELVSFLLHNDQWIARAHVLLLECLNRSYSTLKKHDMRQRTAIAPIARVAPKRLNSSVAVGCHDMRRVEAEVEMEGLVVSRVGGGCDLDLSNFSI